MKVKPIGPPYVDKQTYLFLCPGCTEYDEPGSHLYGSHTFDSTWQYDGNGESPTVSPSILLTRNAGSAQVCHSLIRAGKIEFLGDCSHSLAGKTVDLPDLPEKVKP